jgi:hypothetical protein
MSTSRTANDDVESITNATRFKSSRNIDLFKDWIDPQHVILSRHQARNNKDRANLMDTGNLGLTQTYQSLLEYRERYPS